MEDQQETARPFRPRSNRAERTSGPAPGRGSPAAAAAASSTAAVCRSAGSAERSRPQTGARCRGGVHRLAPASAPRDEAQPQGVVVLASRPQHPLGQAPASSGRRTSSSSGWLKWCGGGEALGEEPVLDRGQRHRPRHRTLLGVQQARAAARHRRQARRSSDARRAAAASDGGPARCARATIWRLRIESPPSAKKLSSTPTRSTPSTSDQIRCQPLLQIACAAPRNPARSAGAPAPGRPAGPPCRWGSAAAPPGPRSRRHHVLRQPPPADATAAPRPPARVSARRPPHRPPAAGRPQRPRAGPPHRAPPDGRRSAASISPSSTRKPRTLTCWSMRPRKSSSAVRAPARQVAGPVEARSRLAAERSGTKRSAVRSGRPR